MSTEIVSGAEPREMTPEEHKAKSEEAFAIETRVKGAMAKGREALWELAEALYDFEEARGWLFLGYDEKSEWLADPEVGMKTSTYNQAVRTWKELVVNRQVDRSTLLELDATKINIVMPAVKQNRVTLDKALGDVKVMGANDLRDSYYRPKPVVADPANAGADDGALHQDGDDEPAPDLDPQPAGEAEWADGEKPDIDGQATEVTPGEVGAVDEEGFYDPERAQKAADGEWAEDGTTEPRLAVGATPDEATRAQMEAATAEPDKTLQQQCREAGLVCIDRVDLEGLHIVLSNGSLQPTQAIELAAATMAEWLAIGEE